MTSSYVPSLSLRRRMTLLRLYTWHRPQEYITSLEALLKTGNDDVTSATGQRLVR